jgi:hypothetical protein
MGKPQGYFRNRTIFGVPLIAGNVDNMKSWGNKRAKISGRNRSLDGSWEVTYTAAPPIFYIGRR